MRKIKTRMSLLLLIPFILLGGCNPPKDNKPIETTVAKPVIYLYPTSEQIVSVRLNY